MSERPHIKLEIWRKAMELVTNVYKHTAKFPKEEIYGLTSQIRRAAVSIPANISEGVARKTTKEYIQFLYIARGSLSELDTEMEIANRLGYSSSEEYEKIINVVNEISRMLSGLIKSLQGKRE